MSEIHKFLFDGLPLKGAIVRLDDSWQEVLRRRAANNQTGAYATPVAELLPMLPNTMACTVTAVPHSAGMLLSLR